MYIIALVRDYIFVIDPTQKIISVENFLKDFFGAMGPGPFQLLLKNSKYGHSDISMYIMCIGYCKNYRDEELLWVGHTWLNELRWNGDRILWKL